MCNHSTHGFSRLPHIQDIILLNRAQNPGLIRIPAKILDPSPMPTMYKGHLLLLLPRAPNIIHIPDDTAPIKTPRAEYIGQQGVPFDLDDCLVVALECVQPFGEVAGVPEGDLFALGGG
jgi:hypothetical protein